MTFTYVLTTDVGKLRLKLGDRTSGSGLRPDGTNFSDEELQVFLDEEDTVGGALALACETLANEWTTWADLQTQPISESFSQIAAGWSERAQQARATLAAGTTGGWKSGTLAQDFIEPEAG